MAETAITLLFGFITDPIKKYLLSPIKTQISYAFKIDSKVEKLQDGVKQLQEKAVRLQDSVDADIRNGKQIYPDVTVKLEAANKHIEEAEKLVQMKEDDMKKKKCFIGLCPNLKTRYQLGKSAEKKASAIVKLINEFPQIDYNEIASQTRPQQIIGPSVYSDEELPSRVLLLNKIMDALRDPNLNMIGVYGMGGVGKTTLAKEVHGKVVAEKTLFDSVIMVAISQTLELRRIQNELADFLGLKFEATELPGRAGELYKRLKNPKILIILDDLWKKLDLYAVGIRSEKLYEGCKIMFTSRDRDLLSGEMSAQQLFSLATLGDDETWRLFEMSVPEAKDPQFHAKATDIAKKCAGLPLLIQLVAAELKGKNIHVWNDMLIQLSALRDDEKVCKVLESSYDNLPEEDMKSFFLLCALFGQSNIRIHHLLTHSMGLGLLRRNNIEAARDKVLTLIDKLKGKSLLLDGDIDGCVKMHDVIRETALSIAARVQHAFIGTGLSNWPNTNCTRISFPYSDVRELPEGLDCPEAELFLLFTKDLCLEIPDSFFKRINKLKVVDLTGMRLMPLPSSIGSLTNLQTLCLHRCRLDNVAMVGKLKLLESLSFANSKFVELPREIEALTRLKLLDLTNCSDLEKIPENVFSKLVSLEELYILNSFVRWNSKGNASLVELDSLSCLTTLEIEIRASKLIPQSCNFFDGLKSYKISIGDEWGNWQGGNDKRSRTLKLKLDAGIHLVDGIKLLLRGAEDLYLSGGRGVCHDLDLDQEDFPKLKRLHIENDFGIQHLIRSTCCVVFPILESLDLVNLWSLETFCYGQLEMGSFGELRILKISGCDKLKRLFPLSFAKCLQQLREMEVESCGNMEAIVGQEGEDEHSNNEAIEFSQLSSLKLKKLPHLKGFCKINERFESEKLLFNEMVSFPNLTSLEVDNCKCLKNVFTASMMKCLVQLKKLVIIDCELVEEIIQSKKDEEIEQENIDVILFPNLDYLQLQNLPNAKTFSFGYSIGFPLLRELRIQRCKAMKNFVSKSSSSNESDDQEYYFFNEMVTFSNLETLFVGSMKKFKYLWDKQFRTADSFSKLKSLNIEYCSKLSVVFPSNACRRFQRLETLHLWDCDGVEEIYEYKGIDFKEAFSLRDLRIFRLHSLKNIWSKDPCGAFTFENLQSVLVRYCGDLKYVFPASIASGLQKLQKLRIDDCKKMEVIIAKEIKDERSEYHSFQFPELTMLELMELKEMRSLYEGPSHTFYCPKLKSMELRKLSNNIFVDKFIANNLVELEIDEQGFNAIQQQSRRFSVDFLYKLKKITLQNLGEQSSIPSVVFGFLTRLKSLEMLVVKFCGLEEILLESDNERPIEDEEQLHHLINLKHLELFCVWKLKHIITIKKKDSQLINHILQHLHTLNVNDCRDLMNIAPSSTSFKNLTTLCVSHCDNMRNLVTASTAKTMVQLMELKVEDCKMIEEIVTKEDGDHDTEHPDMIIFNKLKRLQLYGLPVLNSFCSKNYPFSFPLLEQVTIKGCSRMKIFCDGELSTPMLRGILFEDEQQWDGNLNDTIASQLREWVGGHLEDGRPFRNVESLQVVKDAICSKAILANVMQFLNKLRKITVRDCESVQVVFDLEGLTAEEEHAWLLPKLNELEFINLPLLTQLCNKAPKGILVFNTLKVLKIDKCSRLEYVFTWSMASCLVHLQKIELKNCEMMETIIKEEEAEDGAAQVIHFGSLESIILECLPKFSSIYSGSGDLECPSLNNITMRMCPSIKSFISRLMRDDREAKEEYNYIHFTHKVFPKLKKLALDIKSITAILQVEMPTNFFSKVKEIELGYCSATTKSHVPLLLRFLSRLPNPYYLEVLNSSVEVLFKFEGLSSSLEEAVTTALLQLVTLKLQNLVCLKQIIWCENSQFLASSFQNLTTLEVVKCNELRYLITSSVAKSMVQLETLTVQSCKMLTEIVEDRNDGTTDQEIVFTKMKTLFLYDLESLRSFSSGHCTFKFPCLEELCVWKCPNLRVFCPGNLRTPMLKRVKLYSWSTDSYWEGNLNNTIEEIYKKMVGFQYINDVKLSLFPILKDNWGSQFPFEYFCWLERSVVDDCGIISNAISSHLLQHLRKLKVLIVENCDLVEQVFDSEGLNDIQYVIRRMNNLNELQLIDLPKLSHVWSKDPRQILSFKNLQLLKVHTCGSLTLIFDLSTASSLPNLQHLEVKNCSLVEHIVAQGEDEKMQKHQTIFPSLRSINLQYLTNLLSFYSASGFLECPSLKMIEVVECPNMELFFSSSSNEQDSCIIAEEKKELISNEIVFLGNKIGIPGLEELKVEWNSFTGILCTNQLKFLRGLKCIELTGFQGEEHEILQFNFLQQFPKLEKLAISDSSIEEVNLQELSFLKSEDAESAALLTKLKLSNLPKLKHLVRDDSQLVPLFQNLEDLEAVECSRLKILVPATVSFQNLTNLKVSKCDGMINLMTASTARSLVQLKRMNVKDCTMMQEIVAIASEGVEYEIRFSQLEYLGLDGLPCLTSFSSGNFDFHFPSLKEVLVTGCPDMKIFADQVPTAPKLWKVRTGRHKYDWEWEGSLNTTIQALFLGKDAEGTDN